MDDTKFMEYLINSSGVKDPDMNKRCLLLSGAIKAALGFRKKGGNPLTIDLQLVLALQDLNDFLNFSKSKTGSVRYIKRLERLHRGVLVAFVDTLVTAVNERKVVYIQNEERFRINGLLLPAKFVAWAQENKV